MAVPRHSSSSGSLAAGQQQHTRKREDRKLRRKILEAGRVNLLRHRGLLSLSLGEHQRRETLTAGDGQRIGRPEGFEELDQLRPCRSLVPLAIAPEEFKQLVDRVLAGLMKSGEFEKLYRKWFLSPIPPKGVNLNFPITPAIRDAFKNPNDKGV